MEDVTLGIIGKTNLKPFKINSKSNHFFLGYVLVYKLLQMTLMIGTVDFALKNNKNLMDPVRRKRKEKRKIKKNTKFIFLHLRFVL